MSRSRASIEEPLLSPSSSTSSFAEAVKSSADDPSCPSPEDPPSNDDGPSPTAQPGVLAIEATTQAWTGHSLTTAYIMIWFIYFVETLLAGTTAALIPYVTSAFSMHSFTPTVSILSNVVGGVTNLTIARIIDVFGRPHGLILCYILAVFIADTTKLENRALMQALMNSTGLITGWVAGPLAQRYLGGLGWRWAFAMFSALVPLVTLPLFGLLMWNYRKAKRMGLVRERKTGRNALQSVIHYSREFDAIGLCLVSVGVTLSLLPFNLHTLAGNGWASPSMVVMSILGVCFLVAFVFWERSFAPIRLLPYSLLMDRTVSGACLVCTCLFGSYAIWNSYFSSYLQVVQGLSVEEASYVAQAYTIVSVVFAVLAGYIIHRTGRFKTISLVIGIPLSMLGQGLMVLFLAPGNTGYIIVCFLLISVSQGVLVVTDEIAILAAGSHEHVAAMLALVSIFGNIGGAIGLTIAASIWSDVLPSRLRQYLSPEELPDLHGIFGDLAKQLSYPIASPTRIAIQHAYEDAISRLLLVSTGIWVLGAFGVLMWRNINVKQIQQSKGHVW
ncbi:uncharacterized protein J4E79_011148 [Alternaria viburni]|uniref:uncharacterized protein n=1 Tax=Alternaria viburni TaxID=566460 RepID=UPI0020C595CA|nr:uncharacterized protein J4E79_011148 [Alternaria viburni]KAI4643876.1 hypothetical protein J4E79_011148 [Alternaria viburni]